MRRTIAYETPTWGNLRNIRQQQSKTPQDTQSLRKLLHTQHCLGRIARANPAKEMEVTYPESKGMKLWKLCSTAWTETPFLLYSNCDGKRVEIERLERGNAVQKQRQKVQNKKQKTKKEERNGTETLMESRTAWARGMGMWHGHDDVMGMELQWWDGSQFSVLDD